MDLHHDKLCGIMLGVGAAFPIHAGMQKDALEWIKSSGFHWLYRLCQEPKRLWRRYMDIVPSYIALSFLQLLGLKKYTLEVEIELNVDAVSMGSIFEKNIFHSSFYFCISLLLADERNRIQTVLKQRMCMNMHHGEEGGHIIGIIINTI